jgi:Tfp pilus assembly protein PilO
MPIWIFRSLKKYWWVVGAFLVVFIGYTLFKRYEAGWAGKYEELTKGHTLQMERIEKARIEERVKYQAILEQYQIELDDIRRRYDEQRRQLDAKRKTIARQVIEEHGDDPVKLAEELAGVTGFRVIPRGNNP